MFTFMDVMDFELLTSTYLNAWSQGLAGPPGLPGENGRTGPAGSTGPAGEPGIPGARVSSLCRSWFKSCHRIEGDEKIKYFKGKMMSALFPADAQNVRDFNDILLVLANCYYKQIFFKWKVYDIYEFGQRRWAKEMSRCWPLAVMCVGRARLPWRARTTGTARPTWRERTFWTRRRDRTTCE